MRQRATEQDSSVSLPARAPQIAMATIVLGGFALWIGVDLFQSGDVGMERIILGDVAANTMLLGGLYLGRRRLLANEASRRISFLGVALLASVSAQNLVSWLTDVSVPHAFVHDEILVCGLLSVAAITIERRFALGVPVVLGFALVRIAWPVLTPFTIIRTLFVSGGAILLALRRHGAITRREAASPRPR